MSTLASTKAAASGKREPAARARRPVENAFDRPLPLVTIRKALACTVVSADEEMVNDAGLMRALTDRAGLSLGDRFWLASAGVCAPRC